MKMLTTQMTGLLQRIATNNEMAIEETARLLAQATIGEGRVIIAGFGEMESVATNALLAIEPFDGAVRYETDMSIGTQDRVWILSRSVSDKHGLTLAKQLASQFIPFGVLAAEKPDESNTLFNLAYTYIYTGITKGLLPDDEGQRIIQPHALAALFVYEAVKMEYDEIMKDL